MVEIRIILSETEYREALKAKGTQRWRDILLQAIDMESEKEDNLADHGNHRGDKNLRKNLRWRKR